MKNKGPKNFHHARYSPLSACYLTEQLRQNFTLRNTLQLFCDTSPPQVLGQRLIYFFYPTAHWGLSCLLGNQQTHPRLYAWPREGESTKSISSITESPTKAAVPRCHMPRHFNSSSSRRRVNSTISPMKERYYHSGHKMLPQKMYKTLTWLDKENHCHSAEAFKIY